MPPSVHSYTTSEETICPDNFAAHRLLVSKILEKTGFEAREFQIQAVQAVLRGSDTVVHAGTGSGKTLIFAAPHFVLKDKISIVISPLILLQHDQIFEQQTRMRKLGIAAIALNKEVHIEPETWDELAQGKYEIVLLSPEMALHSEDVHRVFDSNLFRKALVAIHVDEAHTISLWGGGFRKDYRGLGRIRARLPKDIPATLVSATLRPNVKYDAMSTLGFSSDPSKFTDINIGNERTNVFIGTCPMDYPASSFKDVFLFFDPEETRLSMIPLTIIYSDDVSLVTQGVIALYNWLHPCLRDQELIMPVHSWMTPDYRSTAMAKFALGEIRIIWATEAAGMGCDILHIGRIIQFGVCGSIDALVQRFGRAARGANDKGEGWLIYEKSALNYNQDKAAGEQGEPASKKRKIVAGTGKVDTDTHKNVSGARAERRYDPLMQGLITEPVCRRQYLNRVYNNPQSDVPVPPGDCCDLCDPNSASRITPRKFPAQKGLPRAARISGEPNSSMLTCLRTWRKTAFTSVFGASRMFGASALISDTELERISRCAPVPSIDRLRAYLLKWSYVDSQLQSMWEALKAGGFVLPIPSVGPVAALATPLPHPRRRPTSNDRKRPRALKPRQQVKNTPVIQRSAAPQVDWSLSVNTEPPLRHPSPIAVSDLTYFDIPRICAFPTPTLLLNRPPHPPPPQRCPFTSYRRAIDELKILLSPPASRLHSSHH